MSTMGTDPARFGLRTVGYVILILKIYFMTAKDLKMGPV